MTSTPFADILARGEPAIEEMIREGREETLHLEFKTLSEKGRFTRDDRKMVAKAISGFSNAEGGLLVIGIDTKRVDGIDVASGSRPVDEVDRLRSLVAAALPEMLSPQHTSVKVDVVHCSTDLARGYILVDIPTSNDRPHMSLSEQRYFRRGSDGTRVLVHQEIRELMFAARAGSLKIKIGLRSIGRTDDLQFHLLLQLVVQNVGRVPVSAPFIQLEQPLWSAFPSFVVRPSGTRMGLYATRDILIHVNDEMVIAEIATGLDFRGSSHRDVRAAIRTIKQQPAPHAFRMAPASQMGPYFSPEPNVTIKANGVFGGENAPMQAFDFEVGKFELLELFCKLP
jgi:schlafen family protein